MKVRVFLSCLAAGAAAAALTGCGWPSTVIGRNNSPPTVMTLTPAERQTTATVRIGDELKFVLPAGRGPGFEWQIVSNDPRCLRQSGGLVFTPGVKGGAGVSTVSFIAQRPSRSFIRFAYVPTTSGKEEEPVDGYQILVTVSI
jgi:hypothetical protein